MELIMALHDVNNNPNNSKMPFDKVKSGTLTEIKPSSCVSKPPQLYLLIAPMIRFDASFLELIHRFPTPHVS